MFNNYVESLQDQLSAKLIVGNLIIFVMIFVLSVVFIHYLTYKYIPLPSKPKQYLLICSVFTFAMDVCFFSLTLFERFSVYSTLLLAVAFCFVEWISLTKHAEDSTRLLKGIVLQNLIAGVIYLIASCFLPGLYIMLFCMNGI